MKQGEKKGRKIPHLSDILGDYQQKIQDLGRCLVKARTSMKEL